MLAPLALALVTLGAAASAAPATAPAKYRLKSDCHVKGNAGFVVYDETVHPELHATISGPDDDLKVELEGEGAHCTLKGKKKANTIVLAAGQTCPQKITQGGIKGDVLGTLTSGSGKIEGKKARFVTTWDVAGFVYFGPKKMKVKGTVDAKGDGVRI
jgi:hypothetical protein